MEIQLRLAAIAILINVCLLWTLSSAAQAQSNCRVLDPELAGSYQGGCLDGLAHGEGSAKGAASYVGTFQSGRKQGKGTKIWPNGDRYEGSFADDRKEGVGSYTWGLDTPAAGERYQGEYLGDIRSGFGVYTWPSGDQYVGEWLKDAIVGQPTPGMVARARYLKEAEVAMSKGAKVCREVPVGISEKDSVSGTVVGLLPGELEVRIENAGRFATALDGVPLKAGSVVRGAVTAWAPCRG